MISFVVRDGRHFMAHLKIKRALVELLPTPQSVHYICFNIPVEWAIAMGALARQQSKNGKDKGDSPKRPQWDMLGRAF